MRTNTRTHRHSHYVASTKDCTWPVSQLQYTQALHNRRQYNRRQQSQWADRRLGLAVTSIRGRWSGGSLLVCSLTEIIIIISVQKLTGGPGASVMSPDVSQKIEISDNSGAPRHNPPLHSSTLPTLYRQQRLHNNNNNNNSRPPKQATISQTSNKLTYKPTTQTWTQRNCKVRSYASRIRARWATTRHPIEWQHWLEQYIITDRPLHTIATTTTTTRLQICQIYLHLHEAVHFRTSHRSLTPSVGEIVGTVTLQMERMSKGSSHSPIDALHNRLIASRGEDY